KKPAERGESLCAHVLYEPGFQRGMEAFLTKRAPQFTRDDPLEDLSENFEQYTSAVRSGGQDARPITVVLP
ncbi:MAG: hypothetical protein ABW003_18380, partial [Microvirga sp.]